MDSVVKLPSVFSALDPECSFRLFSIVSDASVLMLTESRFLFCDQLPPETLRKLEQFEEQQSCYVSSSVNTRNYTNFTGFFNKFRKLMRTASLQSKTKQTDVNCLIFLFAQCCQCTKQSMTFHSGGRFLHTLLYRRSHLVMNSENSSAR